MDRRNANGGLKTTVRYRRSRLTGAGRVLVLVTGALFVVSMLSANNLMLIVWSSIFCLWIADFIVGNWNLRGLSAARELPVECFAGLPSRGFLVLRNSRRALGSYDLMVQEAGESGAHGGFVQLACGQEGRLSAEWRFAKRGRAGLEALVIRSSFPLGLFRRVRYVELPATLLVYPHPRMGWMEGSAGERVGGGVRARGFGGVGEPCGLREYRSEDSIHLIHWKTTARVGSPMVMQRAGEARQHLVVAVESRVGSAWEKELSRACGRVLWGFSRGMSVGLVLPEERLRPSNGAHWRRTLLGRLANQPEGGGG